MRWWGDPEQALLAFDDPGPGEQAWITVDAEPCGYLRWTPVDRRALDVVGLHEIPSDAVDADLFLASEERCSRGVGRRALDRLVSRLVARGGFSMLGLCTSVDNPRAQRCFEAAGFAKQRTFEDPTYGPCWVMTRSLTGVRKEGAAPLA